MNRKTSIAAITGTFLVTAVMASYPTTASAHGGNADPNVIHACVQQSSNQVRIVGLNGSCTNAEAPVHWGVIGPKGTQGDKGIHGDKGDAGAQGLKGDKGDQGLKGDKGDAGEQGVQGVQGLKGDKGDAGPSSGALIFAQQFGIAPPASYSGGVITVNVNLPKAGTLLVQASGTAWCSHAGWVDLWVSAFVDGVSQGSLNGGTVNCEGGKRRALTSVFVAVPVSAGPHAITFPAGPGAQYDSADRWNVTLLEYSN